MVENWNQLQTKFKTAMSFSIEILVEAIGFEPTTPGLQSRCSSN